jgi:hypothetical protein
MEELTMKTVFAAATGLALVATGAFADPRTGPRSDTVQLRATVAEFIGIISTTDSTIGPLDLVDGTSGSGDNNNVHEDAAGKATVEILSNVQYDIELDWNTWLDEDIGDPTPGYAQANYYNSAKGCSIGGSIHFDQDLNGGGVIYPSGSDTLSSWRLTNFNPGRRTYGIGSQLDPNHTTCGEGEDEGEIAAAGEYLLEVDITLTKH